MIYNNFRVHCTVRAMVLALTIFVFLWTVLAAHFYVVPFVLGALVVYQIYALVYYVERTNRLLATFLESIRYAEFTRSFQVTGAGPTFNALKNAFDDVMRDFQKIRAEKEEQYHYLQNVVQHIGVGLLAFQRDGAVVLINNAAQKLFRTSNLKNISSLECFGVEFIQMLARLRAGNKETLKVRIGDDLLHLVLYATEFKLREQMVTLVSIQNIQNELEEQEMEAWQKLIRVLTHEIMNTITPIASLSSSTNEMVRDVAANIAAGQLQPNDQETIEDIQKALQTIHTRSNGLLHFVESYRSLTNIAKPKFSIYSVKQLFQNLQLLLAKEMERKSVQLLISVSPETLEVTADEKLIEQVLINLVKNSLDALTDRQGSKIELNASLNKQGRIVIEVKDNGPGIMEDVVDKIFVPFFTTKPGGSGIGLSLSRQIIRLHGGTITVKSIPEQETSLILTV